MALYRTQEAIQTGLAAGLHTGAQVCIWRRDELVADLALGEVERDTLLIWLSATKPIVAVAAAILWERGGLDLDDPVSRFIPEFAARGKEGVTIRHILTHTGGFRGVAGSWSPGTWEQIVHRISMAPLEPHWVPGKRAGYHVASSWYILGEVIARVSGRDAGRFVREEVFEPLGMRDSWLAMPAEVWRAYGTRIGVTYDTSGQERTSQGWERQEVAAELRPGANGRGPAHDLARFYRTMLGRGQVDGVRILSRQTVEAMSARHRVGMMDQTFRHVIDWGLGFIVNSEYHAPGAVPYGFGAHASMRTFGHGGSQSSVGFADPENHLAGAIVFNAMPGEARHDARLREVMGALYADLGLA